MANDFSAALIGGECGNRRAGKDHRHLSDFWVPSFRLAGQRLERFEHRGRDGFGRTRTWSSVTRKAKELIPCLHLGYLDPQCTDVSTTRLDISAGVLITGGTWKANAFAHCGSLGPHGVWDQV